MFRLGDFYELFFEDAVTAARELEITLTARNKGKGTAIPMCGVPYHAAEGYAGRAPLNSIRVAGACDCAKQTPASSVRTHVRFRLVMGVPPNYSVMRRPNGPDDGATRGAAIENDGRLQFPPQEGIGLHVLHTLRISRAGHGKGRACRFGRPRVFMVSTP
jgi:hypothetical protein